MEFPEVFHLHYHVPDVDAATTALAPHGIEPSARFGSVEGESVALSPGDPTPDGFRLRLQTNRGGVADVTLTPGPRVDFDHFGVVVEDRSAVVERAKEYGWPVTENDRRTFLVTPWGFRIELQSSDSDVVSTLGPEDDCRFTEVTLVVSDEVRDELEDGIRTVVGDVTNLRVRSSRDVDPAVQSATLAGRRVEDTHFEMPSLGAGQTD